MKRFFILAVMVAAASSSFAYSYYGSYSSPKFEMPGWLTFMCVVMIAWGILEIILFFKIWGMTNDIKALKKDYFNETKFETKEETANHLRRNLVMDNTENVKRILLQNFINNVELDFKSMVSTGYIKDENGDDKWVGVEEMERYNRKKFIRPHIENLQKLYERTGEKIPACIQSMETFEDYFNLIVKEDLEVKTETGRKNPEY